MPDTEQLNRRIDELERLTRFLILSDRYYFKRDLDLADAVNIRLARATGSKIGLSVTDKLAFYGYTPVVQHAVINGPSSPGAVYSQAEVTTIKQGVDDLTDVLQYYGLMAG